MRVARARDRSVYDCMQISILRQCATKRGENRIVYDANQLISFPMTVMRELTASAHLNGFTHIWQAPNIWSFMGFLGEWLK